MNGTPATKVMDPGDDEEPDFMDDEEPLLAAGGVQFGVRWPSSALTPGSPVVKS